MSSGAFSGKGCAERFHGNFEEQGFVHRGRARKQEGRMWIITQLLLSCDTLPVKNSPWSLQCFVQRTGERPKRRPSMKPCKAISIVSAVVVAIWFAGCQQPYHQQEERYILVAANVNLPYWQEAEAGLRDIAKTTGVKVELTGPATFSPSEELTAFQQAVSQHPSGILVSVSDPQSFKGPIDAAVSQGLPVICIDAHDPQPRR